MRSSKLLGIVLIIICLALVLASVSSNNAERYRSSTSFARTPVGLSSFVALAKVVAPDRIVQRRAALLANDDLKDAGIFMTFSPKSAFSEREASIVRAFAEGGGRVVIGIQSPEILPNVTHLLSALDVKITPSEVTDFRNKVTTPVEPQSEGTLFPPKRIYEFYSRYFVTGDTPGSFYFEKPISKGAVTIIMGLPPISNALLGRAENWLIAHGLLAQKESVVLDEYHHLFSDKTVGDLVREPSFAFPIFGMVVVGIFFFLFGRLSKRDAWERKPEGVPARSFHHFGASLFEGLLKESKLQGRAVDEHERFLKALFPQDAHTITQPQSVNGAWLERGARLVQVHKGLLRERGWKI